MPKNGKNQQPSSSRNSKRGKRGSRKLKLVTKPSLYQNLVNSQIVNRPVAKVKPTVRNIPEPVLVNNNNENIDISIIDLTIEEAIEQRILSQQEEIRQIEFGNNDIDIIN